MRVILNREPLEEVDYFGHKWQPKEVVKWIWHTD